MTRPALPPDRLAAFVDGELSPEEAAAVVRHLADHPQDQALVDDLMAANLALQRAFSAPLAEPVPPAILATIQGAVPFRRRGVPVWAAGLGAALAAAAAALAVVAILPAPAPGGLAVGPVAPGSALDRVLTATATGTDLALPDGSRLSVLASLPADGGFCREVERLAPGAAEVALACTTGQGWTVDVVLAEGLAPAPDGFVPASGEGAGALGPWLDRRGAGQVLSPADEAAALARGWR